MTIRSILTYWQRRKRLHSYRDLHLVTDLTRSAPYALTRNNTMKLMLGVPPDERAVDSDDMQARRFAAVEELKLMREKVKQ